MKRTLPSILLLATFLPLAPTASAFMPNPNLFTVTPAVAKAGSTVEVRIYGEDVDEADRLRFNHPDIVGEPLMHPANDLHPEPRRVKRRFEVTIPADVEPGVYEVRSHGYFGLSTARPFLVLPPGKQKIAEEGDHSTRDTALPLEVESGVLGTLDAGQYDWYSFKAKEGERLLLEVIAERLDSQADVLLTVCDDQGRRLESSRHHFGRDPFVDFTAPADGTYYVSLTDSLYEGGRKYFYHLEVGRGPHVDFVFPPAGEPGEKRRFTFFGRNLPGGSLGAGWELGGKPLATLEKAIHVPEEVRPPDSFAPGLPRQGILPGFEVGVKDSNRVEIGFATAPVALEASENEEQRVAVPTEIAGRFDEPGDADTFRISAKKGKTYWIEVISHRLGTRADPVVVVEKVTKDEKGEESLEVVAENDDLPSFFGQDNLDDINADSLDPALSFTPEENGPFRISLLNQSAGGGAAHLYRLAIREARHDFRLIAGIQLTKTINNDAIPASPLLRRGGSLVYRIMALRRDGFHGDITVTAKGLPEGVTAEPLVLADDTREGYLTLWATPDASAWSGSIDLVGEAKIGKESVTRTARTATIVWEKRVFARSSQIRSRLGMETVLSVIDSESEPTRLAPAEDEVWTVAMNDTLKLPIRTTETGNRVGTLQVNVHGFPGLHRNPPKVAIPESKKQATIPIPFKKRGSFDIEPGRYQFVLQGIGNRKYSRNPAAVKRTEAEVERLKELARRLTGEVEKAKTTLKTAKKAHAAAVDAEASAADDAARKPLKAETAQAKERLEAAEKALESSQAKLRKVGQLQKTAKKQAKEAARTAKEQTVQFATFSQPITVEVKPEPEKK